MQHSVSIADHAVHGETRHKPAKQLFFGDVSNNAVGGRSQCVATSGCYKKPSLKQMSWLAYEGQRERRGAECDAFPAERELQANELFFSTTATKSWHQNQC